MKSWIMDLLKGKRPPQALVPEVEAKAALTSLISQTSENPAADKKTVENYLTAARISLSELETPVGKVDEAEWKNLISLNHVRRCQVVYDTICQREVYTALPLLEYHATQVRREHFHLVDFDAIEQLSILIKGVNLEVDQADIETVIPTYLEQLIPKHLRRK